MLLKEFSNTVGLCFLLICKVIHCTRFSPGKAVCNTWSTYTCTSGQCIENIYICDGIADCDDASDEVVDLCGIGTCSAMQYRCDYGACVKPNAKCDGVKDCSDGSDEQGCTTTEKTTDTTTTHKQGYTTTEKTTNTTTTRRRQIAVNCLKPNDPDDGVYEIAGQESLSPGDVVQQFSVLLTTCNSGYQASPDNTFFVCVNGIWTPLPPKCSPNHTNCLRL